MNDKPERQRRPVLRGLAVVALLCALAILATLGTWQASRFLEKRETFALMDERQAQPRIDVKSATQLGPELDFRNVALVGGKLLMESTVVVERRFHDHQPGDWTLTPYQFADGSIVVVHTGWIPEARPEMVGNEPASLDGLVVTPVRVTTDTLARESGPLDFTNTPRLGELDAAYLYESLNAGPPRHDTIVVLNGARIPNQFPTPSFDHITKPYLTPAAHFGYATLWFGSALLLIWLFWAGWTGRLDPSAR